MSSMSVRNLLPVALLGFALMGRAQSNNWPRTFQSLSSGEVLVLGSDGNLWLEHAPFGKVPPARNQVDGSVRTFQALSGHEILVLGSDGNLWLEHGPFGTVPPGRAQIDGNVHAFQALSDSHVLVLGTDGNLWLEHAPFGSVPPGRAQIDGNVQAFQALSGNEVLVLGTNGNLWLERAPFGEVPPARDQIDGNVQAFQALSNSVVLVLGTDGKLWLELAPFGKVIPPARDQIDGNVQAFEALSASEVLVLSTDGTLWLEQSPFGKVVPPARAQVDGRVDAFEARSGSLILVLGIDGALWREQSPFGNVPPRRDQIDGNVALPQSMAYVRNSTSRRTFQALSAYEAAVLGSDGNLWLEHVPFGRVPPTRDQIDGNVQAFQALSAFEFLVLGSDGNLWLEHAPFGRVPPARDQVDGNVQAFQALSAFEILVLGYDGNLWLEHTPFGRVPPARDQVDGNVQAFQPLSATQVVVLGSDGNLWLEHAPFGTVPPARNQIDGNVRAFQALSAREMFVLGTDGNLWLEQTPAPFGIVPPPRKQVDGNVQTFQALSANEVFVLGTDGNLWNEWAPFGPVPPARNQVDGNVETFQALSASEVFVLGTNGNLWNERAPFGPVPPARDQVDANVALADGQCDLESCISEAKLSANISSVLQDKVVGYVAIVGGLPPVTGGLARTAADSPQTAMSTDLVMNIASVSKTLTAIGIRKALAAAGLTIDTNISSYIYSDWTQDSSIKQLTFKELLNHTSGFGQMNSCAGSITYGDLKTLVAGGVQPSTNIGTPSYGNCNFALLRELLPSLLGQSITNLSDDQRAQASSKLYIDYMNQNVFQPLGIPSNGNTRVTCSPPQWGKLGILSYPFPAGSTNGDDWGDWSNQCGSGGWLLTATDLFTVVNDLANGNVLLTGAQKSEMYTNCLGWDCAVRPDCPDPYVCKNGDLTNGNIAVWTYAGIFKCNVPVIVYVNSFLPAPYQPYDANGKKIPNNRGDIIGLVQDAYNNSVTISYRTSGSPGKGQMCSIR